jgi:hypothetical protein
MLRSAVSWAAIPILLAISGAQDPGRDQGTPGQPSFDARFDQYWSDNQAELAGYEFTTPRYGQLRKGTAVTIFVTEPFSNSARVKADPGKHPPSDEFPAMKLNLVEDFSTGIYDYNLMTSVFVALRSVNNLPPGTPAKISFSGQEWCGHVYHQLLIDENSIRSERHSYFDGEADADEKLENHPDALYEDAILLWARGLAGPYMSPGQTRDADLLRSVKVVRLRHVPLKWERAKLTRKAETEKVTVPAGTFDAEVRTVEVPGDAKRTWTIYVEHAHPHHILKWTCSDGEQAELLGADRLTYWQMNREGFQSALTKLGLTPRGARMP